MPAIHALGRHATRAERAGSSSRHREAPSDRFAPATGRVTQHPGVCPQQGGLIAICYLVHGGEPVATINVRRLDDDVVDRLKRRASLNNRSLEGEARHILECAADDNMAAMRAAFLEASDRLREKTRGRRQTPAEVLIREDRDRGHRDDF